MASLFEELDAVTRQAIVGLVFAYIVEVGECGRGVVRESILEAHIRLLAREVGDEAIITENVESAINSLVENGYISDVEGCCSLTLKGDREKGLIMEAFAEVAAELRVIEEESEEARQEVERERRSLDGRVGYLH